jgi:lysophospholipid acyltransferase (LPLAT)-like uncharacterized protein
VTMKRFYYWIIARLYWLSITLLYKSARIQTEGEEQIRNFFAGEQKVLFGFFHGDYLLLFPRFKRPDVCIFSTRSRRGELLSRLIHLFGYTPGLIPDTRGSKLALEQMVQQLRKGYHAVLAVDGPLGPYHQVKHGIVVLAQRTGNPIIPVAMASSWNLVFKKRWDRYTIPLPFTRALILFGEPLSVPADAGQEEIESFRSKVEEELNRLNRSAHERLNRQHRDRAV